MFAILDSPNWDQRIPVREAKCWLSDFCTRFTLSHHRSATPSKLNPITIIKTRGVRFAPVPLSLKCVICVGWCARVGIYACLAFHRDQIECFQRSGREKAAPRHRRLQSGAAKGNHAIAMLRRECFVVRARAIKRRLFITSVIRTLTGLLPAELISGPLLRLSISLRPCCFWSRRKCSRNHRRQIEENNSPN